MSQKPDGCVYILGIQGVQTRDSCVYILEIQGVQTPDSCVYILGIQDVQTPDSFAYIPGIQGVQTPDSCFYILGMYRVSRSQIVVFIFLEYTGCPEPRWLCLYSWNKQGVHNPNGCVCILAYISIRVLGMFKIDFFFVRFIDHIELPYHLKKAS